MPPLLLHALTAAATWVVAAPLAWWLGFQIPFERGRALTATLKHTTACAVVVLMGAAWRTLLSAPEAGAGMLMGPPPWVAQSQSPLEIEVMEGAARLHRPFGPPPLARAMIDALVYMLLASIGLAAAWSRRARARERSVLRAEAELARTRLAALQMQLNPHFLFNVLNGISSLIHTDPHAADDMLGDLSGLLRAALDTAGEVRIPLSRELAILDCYLGIEQRRFGARLRIGKTISEGAMHALVPTFILQPLLENAIKHGIEPRRAPGFVMLTVARKEGRVRIRIEDSGPGLSTTPAVRPGSGIGLANTRARLDHHYPGDYELTGCNGASQGFVLTLDMPYVEAPSNSQAAPSL